MAIQLVFRGTEVRLMETLNNIREPSNWHAIHFHLADLLEEYKSEYQIKIAINLIHDVLKNYDGSIFLMSDNSIIVLCYGLEKTLRSKLIFQVRYLYMDDPLAYSEDGRENTYFASSYDLTRQWTEFFDLCSQRMARTMRKSSAKNDGTGAGWGLSALRLATIERDLEHADLSEVIRRQPACAVMPDLTVRRVFDELYINIAHLRQILKSEVDFLSNRWLFKYITQLLDMRVVELLRQQPAQYLNTAVSLNLNVESLLSSWFDELDAAIDPARKVSIVIEIPVVDIFADMNAFITARDEVQRLGYRICIDGLTTRSFTQINRESLGADLMKMQWNADSKKEIKTKENMRLAEAVQECGTNRMILCRCDNRQAVEYGQALGISLFQGRYIDSIFNPTAKIEN